MTTRDTSHLRTDDQLDPDATPPAPGRPAGVTSLLSVGRNLWRQLTSMRIALILLFLLALASLPGALLPQWNLNQAKTAQFILDHPTIGPILDRTGFFAVFGSPWYAAIYLALFTSLIGCLVPRSWDFVRVLRSKPVPTPRNLVRLPHHASLAGESPAVVAERVSRGLKGWRQTRRAEADDAVSISAEKGFLREVGNLVFHFSLLGLLGAIAVGKMFGFEGTVVVTEGGGFCSGSPSVYDTFHPGLLVDGTELAPFCVDLDSFSAAFTDAGQATDFDAKIRYEAGASAADSASDTAWTARDLKVNDPLRINGERLYLLGHGFTPEFQVTFPNGEVRTGSQIFQPSGGTLLSEGVVKFLNPPGYTGADIVQHQLALQGLFAPTAAIGHDGIMTSTHPSPSNPGVAIQVYRGDLGMQNGAPQSIFSIDQKQVDSGALVKLNRANMMLGESMKLDDGTIITFTGYKQWVQLQTSYDPAQGFALIFAITLLIGLMLSLTIKRRRVWYRITPGDGGSTIEVGGLARTDQAGYGEEFTSLVKLARPPNG